MKFLSALVVLAAGAAANKAPPHKVVQAPSASDPTGRLLSAQTVCSAPCAANRGFYLTATDPIQKVGVDNDVKLQTYLPEAVDELRDFEAFTAFDESSRTMLAVAADYPAVGGLTFWTSTISNQVDAAKPVVDGKFVKYPDNTSPAPLNVLRLRLSRVLPSSVSGEFLAVFTNGEVHRFSADGVFTKVLDGISPEDQLSADYPTMTWAQVYDKSRDGIWSVAFPASSPTLTFSDLRTGVASAPIPLVLGVNQIGSFAPEKFSNAFMVDLKDGAGSRLVVANQALTEQLGFDQFHVVDTDTGLMDPVAFNLMDFNVDLTCTSAFECDAARVSAWDPVGQVMYFQGHDGTEDSLGIYSMSIQPDHQGDLYTLVWPSLTFTPTGHNGFQFVNFA